MLSGTHRQLGTIIWLDRLAYHNPSKGAGNILRASTSHAGTLGSLETGYSGALSGLGSSLDEG